MYQTIRKPDEQDEYLTDEGCWILELSNHADDPAVSIARARVSPGQTTKWHKVIGIEERYVMLHGNGRVEVGDMSPIAIGPGEVVSIAAGERQEGGPLFQQPSENEGENEVAESDATGNQNSAFNPEGWVPPNDDVEHLYSIHNWRTKENEKFGTIFKDFRINFNETL